MSEHFKNEAIRVVKMWQQEVVDYIRHTTCSIEGPCTAIDDYLPLNHIAPALCRAHAEGREEMRQACIELCYHAADHWGRSDDERITIVRDVMKSLAEHIGVLLALSDSPPAKESSNKT